MAHEQPVIQHAARNNRQGVAAALVVAALLVGLLLYGRHSVHVSNVLRVRAALNTGEAYAASVRDTVDARATALHGAVVEIAASAKVRNALSRGDRRVAEGQLKRATRQGDALLAAALYGANGRLLAGSSTTFPAALSPAELQAGAALYAAAIRGQDGEPRLASVVPLVGRTGYALGLCPFARGGSRDKEAASDAGYAVYVVQPEGQVAASWGDANQLGSDDAPLDQIAATALKEGPGSTVIFTRDVMRRRLTSYAVSARTGQVVVATEFAEHALVPSRYMVARLFDMALPTLALVGVAGWALFSYYYRERQLARTLASANVRLDAEARAGSDLLANVSHDLRTPLAAMRIAISGLLDPSVPWDQAAARESLETARGQLDRLTAKVRNLLVMARLESGKQDRRADLCDLTDVVDGALSQVRPLLQDRGIEVDFPDQPIMVRCDQVQIETVIVNLVENALKYSPSGSPLHLAGHVAGPWARITVRDCGPGVPPGAEAEVFAKFYRCPETAHVGGAGLGLAICKSIIEAHGGSIGVRNAPDGGAEFWFELPVPLIELTGPTVVEVAQ